MADSVLSCFQGCWAKILPPFISWKLTLQLFLPFATKESLNRHCTSDLVSFRFSLFAKPCYALDRSPCHEHVELWIHENGWVFTKLCWNEIWCSNLFLFDASLIAWFDENECYIVDVCWLMSRVICLLFISGTNYFSRLGWWWTVMRNPKNAQNSCCSRFALLRFLFAWNFYCLIAMTSCWVTRP